MVSTDEFQPRAFPRYEIQASVSYYTASHTEEDCSIENLSLGGMCIRSGKVQEIGTPIQLTLRVPSYNLVLDFVGEIAWVNRAHPMDIGIRFAPLTEHQRAMLQQHLQTHFGSDHFHLSRSALSAETTLCY